MDCNCYSPPVSNPAITIMDAYDNGEFVGPQPMSALTRGRSGRMLRHLGFTLVGTPENPLWEPPKRRRGARTYDWPASYRARRLLMRRGWSDGGGYNLVGLFTPEVVLGVLKAEERRPTGRPIEALCREYIAARTKQLLDSTEEVITKEEFAEILRESPQLPMAGLKNRMEGLVKVATRRGDWLDDIKQWREAREDYIKLLEEKSVQLQKE